MVSAAGVAPAITPSRTEHVAATLRAVCPGAIRKGAGGLFSLAARRSVPGRRPAVRFKNWRTRRELHPQPSRRQRGALLIELRVQMKWKVGRRESGKVS